MGKANAYVAGLLLIAAVDVAARDRPGPTASLQYDLDTRGFDTVTVMVDSGELPHRFSLWGYTDFQTGQDGDWGDLDQHFWEYRLSHAGLGDWLGVDGLGVQLEYNAASGESDLLRLGLTYQHVLPLPWTLPGQADGWLEWRAFGLETDGDGGQLSLSYYIPFASWLSLFGWVDLHVIGGRDNPWVLEPQLDLRLHEHVSLVLEFRYSDFISDESGQDDLGFAPGIRVVW